MPRINQQLLQRLKTHLGVNQSRVYALIANKAAQTMLDRELAALALAADKGINIHRYSTNDQRAQLRGSLNPREVPRTSVSNGVETQMRHPVKRTKSTLTARSRRDNSVFVVHGRNESLRRSLFDFLRALDLKPLEWEKAVLMTKKTNPYIGEILDTAMSRVQAVVVLLSPDDEARLKTKFQAKNERASEKQLRGQPRPNVLFEAGLALGRHPGKTILVEVGKLRKFSDIAGKHVIRLTNDYAKRNDLANRLEALGCRIDKRGTDWTSTGNFLA